VDYDSAIHTSGFSLAAIGVLAWQQLWLPFIAVVAIAVAAVLIRYRFRRGKKATDV
jgi:Flp pilus assembly protein TadB